MTTRRDANDEKSPSPVVAEVLRLFRVRGDSQYGGEAVTQREHALQAALLAVQAGADSQLIAAALLHDVGHLLHRLPDDSPERGADDLHETLAARWLERRFGPAVVEPVRLHVAAKRYLCAVDPSYFGRLSAPSILSLQLQGGPMSEAEVQAFREQPHLDAAIALRRWDDAAKARDFPTPPLEHFASDLETARRIFAESSAASQSSSTNDGASL